MLSFYMKFWTDRQTPVKQYAPNLSTQGHKTVCDEYQFTCHMISHLEKV